jgi:hypothetical protein
MPERRGVGVGLVILKQGRVTHQHKANIGNSQLVYNREPEGATRAIEHAGRVAQLGQHFKLYAGNQARLYQLQTTPTTQAKPAKSEPQKPHTESSKEALQCLSTGY